MVRQRVRESVSQVGQRSLAARRFESRQAEFIETNEFLSNLIKLETSLC